jgi:hypothetical protein
VDDKDINVGTGGGGDGDGVGGDDAIEDEDECGGDEDTGPPECDVRTKGNAPIVDELR